MGQGKEELCYKILFSLMLRVTIEIRFRPDLALVERLMLHCPRRKNIWKSEVGACLKSTKSDSISHPMIPIFFKISAKAKFRIFEFGNWLWQLGVASREKTASQADSNRGADTTKESIGCGCYASTNRYLKHLGQDSDGDRQQRPRQGTHSDTQRRQSPCDGRAFLGPKRGRTS